MRLENSGGDVLARGGAKASFSQGKNVTRERWDDIFKDFDPEKYRRDAGPSSSGDGGTIVETDQASAI